VVVCVWGVAEGKEFVVVEGERGGEKVGGCEDGREERERR